MADSRRIRRLRLHAAREEDARRGAILIEDAIRTASFPEADAGRLFVIRRLELGRIRRNAAPTTVALQAEHALRRLLAAAVPFDAPGAAAAEIVSFPGRGHALTALIGRHARKAPADEWFWTRAVPEWDSKADRPAKWRALFEATAVRSGSAALQAEAAFEAVRQDAASELLEALSEPVAIALLTAAGFLAPEPIGDGLAGVDAASPVSEAAGRVSAQVPLLPDDRLVWLLVMLAVRRRPTLAADRKLPTRVRRWLESVALRGDGSSPHAPSEAEANVQPPSESRGLSSDEPSLPHHADPSAVDPGSFDARDEEAAPASGSPTVRPFAEEGGTERRSAASAKEERPGHRDDDRLPWFDSVDAEPTEAAGLFFLVAVFRALGIDAVMDRQPDLLAAGFGARFLRFVAAEAGVLDEDPMLTALDRLGGEDPLPYIIILPESFDVLIAPIDCSMQFSSPFGPLGMLVAHWCRRRAGMDPSSLIRRPGRVSISPTHVDVHLGLSQIDLRIRRAALDVDPGWLPWLGRVVQFHYREFDD